MHFAYKNVLKNKTKNRDALEFIFYAEYYLRDLQVELNNQTYTPRPPFVFFINDPKVREIHSFKLRDMIVQRVILERTYELFRRKFIPQSFGGLPNKGPRRALQLAQSLTRKFEYYLKCDVAKFYDSIDHSILKKMLKRTIKDTFLLTLLDKIIHSHHKNRNKGISIGALLSQYFANLYLTPLDNYLKCYLGIKGYVRYMDDFIVFHNDRLFLVELRKKITIFLETRLQLFLNSHIQRIDSVYNGVDFLGFKIFRHLKRIRRKNLVRMRKKLKDLHFQYKMGKKNIQELHDSTNSYLNHLNQGDMMEHNKKFFECFKI